MINHDYKQHGGKPTHDGSWTLREIVSENIPIPSMYGVYTHIYHKSQPNVGKYTIHGSFGI